MDSPVETVSYLTAHVPVYHFSCSRFALGNKLSKIHARLFQYIDKLLTYVFYIITWRRIENVTFETCCCSRLKLYFSITFFLLLKLTQYLIICWHFVKKKKILKFLSKISLRNFTLLLNFFPPILLRIVHKLRKIIIFSFKFISIETFKLLYSFFSLCFTTSFYVL